MRGTSSLLPALAASVMLHTGAATLADMVLAKTVPGAGTSAAANRPAELRVFLTAAAPRPLAVAAAAAPSLGSTARSGRLDLPLPYYFAPDELERKPQPIGEVPLTYPADLPLVARSRIVLSLLIGEGGTVDRVIVEAADAPPELERLAIQAFAGTRFTPGMREGTAVKSRLRVEVTFEAG